jgi:predicted nucleotidyltransferase
MAKRTDLEKTKEIAARYGDTLKKNIKVKNMYLFGSFVKKTNHKDSDIDVAVISNSFKDHPINDRVMLMKYTWDIDMRIEPHPFLPKEFNKTNPFVREIMNTGIKII